MMARTLQRARTPSQLSPFPEGALPAVSDGPCLASRGAFELLRSALISLRSLRRVSGAPETEAEGLGSVGGPELSRGTPSFCCVDAQVDPPDDLPTDLPLSSRR